VSGRQVPVPTGHAWLVWLGPGASDDGQHASDGAPPPPPQNGALLTDRAAELARYSQQLLSPLLARLEQQATELGGLRNELAHARGRIAELETPSAHGSVPSPAEGQAGRSWWRRLIG
jgi:hypothetical protein